MFGLAYLIFFAVYLLASLAAVILAAVWAGRRKRSRLLWGGVAALLMYNLVFWDWLPTVYAHKYYCEKEAGFWVYKTLDQWKAENPGVGETLVANKVVIQRVGDEENHTDTIVRNQRFNSVNQIRSPIPLLSVYSSRNEIVDRVKDEVLARYVDVSSGKGRDSLKFWNIVQGCSNGTKNRIAFLEFSEQLEKMTDTTKRTVK